MSHTALLALAAGFAEAENHVLTTLRECDCQIKGRYVEGEEDDDDDEDDDEDDDVDEASGSTYFPVGDVETFKHGPGIGVSVKTTGGKLYWTGKDWSKSKSDAVGMKKNEADRFMRRSGVSEEFASNEPISEAESMKNLDLLYDVAADYITSEADSVLADVFAAYYNQNSEEHMFAVAKDIGAIKKSDFDTALKIAGVDKSEHQTAQHIKDGLFALTRQIVVDIMLDDDDDETPEPVAAMPTK